MSEPLVLGAVLRVDLIGWSGVAPLLPRAPIQTCEGLEPGATSFFYDLLPNHAFLPAGQACERIGMLIESLLDPWPLDELAFPARCRLDIGLSAETDGVWSCGWPVAFLSALAQAQIELGLSFYPSVPDDALADQTAPET